MVCTQKVKLRCHTKERDFRPFPDGREKLAEKNAKSIQILHLFILNPTICTALKLMLLKEQFYPTHGHPTASGQENCVKKNIQDKIFWAIMAQNTPCTVVVPSNIRNLESKSFWHCCLKCERVDARKQVTFTVIGQKNLFWLRMPPSETLATMPLPRRKSLRSQKPAGSLKDDLPVEVIVIIVMFIVIIM